MISGNSSGHRLNNKAGEVSLVDSSTNEWTVTHDFAFAFGGAELVTSVLSRDLLPGAPVVTVGGSRKVLEQISGSRNKSRRVVGFVSGNTYRYLLPLYPFIVRAFPNVRGNVLASSYAFAHGIRCTGSKVVYCHSPLRQAWSGSELYSGAGAFSERLAVRIFGPYLRWFDRRFAKDVDVFIATSRAVKERIERYYDVSNVVLIPPPLKLPELSDPIPHHARGESFLWVGRVIEPYKRLGLVLDVMRARPDLHLDVVGDGRDLKMLRADAPTNVTFLGWQGKASLSFLYANAAALLFGSEDDFGIVPVEAMACGTPVIAYGAGGALDTVVHGQSGLLFHSQTPESMLGAIKEFESMEWNSESIAKNTRERFSKESFLERMRVITNGTFS
ncbi:glycosyltransferase [Rhodococcus sp. ARC_M5]|uniref:glycosyltransferase n=1 Tax=Rhodococcus sp. ARC_M5 TaxID=2928851 RepID=UPI001FB472F4|nr:glycosyltransferase [Rhodococcus sp. ARC_M5]MCJ0892079.1 glycosyltransferase [Rhodococcus sp. ARC_M5]